MSERLAQFRISSQRILHKGLLTGKWSVSSFNGRQSVCDLVLPSWDFLEANPQFKDPDYRDDAAYRRLHWPYTQGSPVLDDFQ